VTVEFETGTTPRRQPARPGVQKRSDVPGIVPKSGKQNRPDLAAECSRAKGKKTSGANIEKTEPSVERYDPKHKKIRTGENM